MSTKQSKSEKAKKPKKAALKMQAGRHNPEVEADAKTNAHTQANSMANAKVNAKASANANTNSNAYDIEEVILKYWPQIRYRVIKTFGYNNPEWEDTASEILLSVVEAIKFERFREESSIGTFIYSITSNKIVDAIRKKGKAVPTVEMPEKFLDPKNHIERKETSIFVSELIKTLKPRHADMLYLYYYIDLSQIQIGKIFGISSRRVHTILNDAKRALKRLVESS